MECLRECCSASEISCTFPLPAFVAGYYPKEFGLHAGRCIMSCRFIKRFSHSKNYNFMATPILIMKADPVYKNKSSTYGLRSSWNWGRKSLPSGFLYWLSIRWCRIVSWFSVYSISLRLSLLYLVSFLLLITSTPATCLIMEMYMQQYHAGGQKDQPCEIFWWGACVFVFCKAHRVLVCFGQPPLVCTINLYRKIIIIYTRARRYIYYI